MGLFKKLGKALKKVAKPLVGTIARTVVGSVPVLGGVVSAVGAVKSSLHPPTRANTANLSARTGAPAFGHPGIMHTPRTRTPHGTRTRRRAGSFAGWVSKAKREDAYKREARLRRTRRKGRR